MTAGIHTLADKRVELDALAALVRDGDCLALGGGLTCRLPMAGVRALVRRNVRGLRVVGSAHGIDVDLLCGAGAVGATSESYVGFEVDFGMAPNYRRACESGQVAVTDSCCYTLVQQLRATIAGLPFMPLRSIRGTDVGRLHPEFKTMTCPFTGEELVLAPALAPDVALLHAQYADPHGNVRIEGPPVADLLFARAARTVLVTAEQIVSNERLVELGGANVPYFYVTAVAHVEMGAHPTACYPNYAYDRAHIARYYDAAKAGGDAFRREYLTPYVLECSDEAAYLARCGGSEMRARVQSWEDGQRGLAAALYGRTGMNDSCTMGEAMIYALARTIENGTLVFHGYGSPLVQLAMHVAKRTHARDMVLVEGATYAINPQPVFLTPVTNDRALERGAECSLEIDELFDLAASGRMGRMFLSGIQIDRFGNANVTLLGDEERLAVKLPGGGGGCNLSCDAEYVTLWTTGHRAPPDRNGARRYRLVQRCDFVTSFGHRTAEGRTRAELRQRGRGPQWLVTDLGVFDFDSGGQLRLRELYPDTTLADIEQNTEFAPLVATDLRTTPLPDAEIVRLIRELDPLGIHRKELRPADLVRRFARAEVPVVAAGAAAR